MRYRRRPTAVEAVQWPIAGSCPGWFMDAMTLPDPADGIATLRHGQVARYASNNDLAVCTLHGVVWATPGDWILYRGPTDIWVSHEPV